MLVRIVYYFDDNLPEERIIATNDVRRAEDLAKEEMKKLRAREYEVEWVA